MSRFNKINFLALTFLFLLFSPQAQAKTLQFGNETFEITASFAETTDDLGTRAADLTSLSKHVLLNSALPRQNVFDPEAVARIEAVAQQINQLPRSAKLVIEEEKVVEFDPGQNGQSLDLHQLY